MPSIKPDFSSLIYDDLIELAQMAANDLSKDLIKIPEYVSRLKTLQAESKRRKAFIDEANNLDPNVTPPEYEVPEEYAKPFEKVVQEEEGWTDEQLEQFKEEYDDYLYKTEHKYIDPAYDDIPENGVYYNEQVLAYFEELAEDYVRNKMQADQVLGVLHSQIETEGKDAMVKRLSKYNETELLKDIDIIIWESDDRDAIYGATAELISMITNSTFALLEETPIETDPDYKYTQEERGNYWQK